MKPDIDGVIDGIGNGRERTADTDLSHTLGSERAGRLIGGDKMVLILGMSLV